MKSRNIKTKGGYSLVEVLFYIAIFSILTLAVINALISMTRAFRETVASTDLMQSAGIMERISREVRQASSISSIGTSDLKLNTHDEAGTAKTVRFLLSGTNVQLLENDVLTGNLNTPNIQVSTLTFTQITTTTGTAIKIKISVTSTRDRGNRVEDFYDTIVLRGAY